MISPEDIRSKAIRLWESHRLHRAHLEGISLFPWEIKVPRVTAKELAEAFPQLRAATQRLEREAKRDGRGGYSIKYTPINHRRLGSQSLPHRIVVASVDEFLQLTGKRRQYERFIELTSGILVGWPELKALLSRQPALVLDHADDWDRLLAVCRYFRGNPRPGLYVRQLDIPGVDTKFIEARRAIIAELLSAVLPPDALTETNLGLSNHGFEQRFGLRFEAPSIRFRLLDGALAGATDISVPLSEFRQLSLRVRRVFITENKMNGLAFPECRDSLVIFGLGSGVNSLREVPWLRETEVFYWGDIDTYGFAILSRLREFLPSVRSLLMDEGTLLAHRELWGREDDGQRYTKSLEHLTPAEGTLFQGLRDNRWGENVRLEQERIAFGHVRRAVGCLDVTHGSGRRDTSR